MRELGVAQVLSDERRREWNPGQAKEQQVQSDEHVVRATGQRKEAWRFIVITPIVRKLARNPMIVHVEDQ